MAKIAVVTLVYKFEYPEDFSRYDIESRAVEDFNEAVRVHGWFEEGSIDIEILEES